MTEGTYKNGVSLAGVVVKDPDCRQTATSGKKVAHLTIQTKHDRFSEFHHIVLWEALAERAAHLTKNDFVQIQGRLQTRSWEDPQTKTKKYATEVVAWSLIIPEKETATPPSPEVRDAAATRFR
jgi:single-strand DNA-binding protein